MGSDLWPRTLYSPKGCIDKSTEGLACTEGNLLSRKSEHGSERDNGNKVDSEHGLPAYPGIVCHDTARGTYEQDVDPLTAHSSAQLILPRIGLFGGDVPQETKCQLLLGLFVLRLLSIAASGRHTSRSHTLSQTGSGFIEGALGTHFANGDNLVFSHGGDVALLMVYLRGRRSCMGQTISSVVSSVANTLAKAT